MIFFPITLTIDCFSTKRCRLTSAQLLNKFAYCPSWTVTIVLAFHKHNRLLLIHSSNSRAPSWSSWVVGYEGCIRPSGKLLCLCQTAKNCRAHALHHSIHVWLLDRSSCSSPSTKELHAFAQQITIQPDPIRHLFMEMLWRLERSDPYDHRLIVKS